LFELKQQRKYFASSGQVSVKFGAPVRFAAAETATEITHALQAAIASLTVRNISQPSA
jgi:hypothetical protein